MNQETLNMNFAEYKDKFEKLPPDIQGILLEPSFDDLVYDIADTHVITSKNTEAFYEEIVFVLIGETHPKDFIPNLSKKLSLTEEQARVIARDVNENIFSLAKESLKKLHGVTEGQQQTMTQPLKNEISAVPPRPTTNMEKSILPTPPTKPLPQTPKATQPPQNLPTEKSLPAFQSAPEKEKGSIFEQKLQNVFSVPKEELNINEKKDAPLNTPPQQTPSHDPYREPIN